MVHLVRFVQDMTLSPHLRASINRMLLDELRIITIEQQEELYPTPGLPPPSWKPDAPIPERALPIVKNLLLETLTAIDDLGELEDVPEPYREILSLVQRDNQDGQEIADWLIYNLSGMIEELKKLRR